MHTTRSPGSSSTASLSAAGMLACRNIGNTSRTVACAVTCRGTMSIPPSSRALASKATGRSRSPRCPVMTLALEVASSGRRPVRVRTAAVSVSAPPELVRRRVAALLSAASSPPRVIISSCVSPPTSWAVLSKLAGTTSSRLLRVLCTSRSRSHSECVPPCRCIMCTSVEHWLPELRRYVPLLPRKPRCARTQVPAPGGSIESTAWGPSGLSLRRRDSSSSLARHLRCIPTNAVRLLVSRWCEVPQMNTPRTRMQWNT
mmetsp:Transcript_39944/g.127742  ORF Transcript_39944/g.127742 Transcript_39944/m.127742 type:complete len:258 (+) Transcript_39944:1416-2189(+)